MSKKPGKQTVPTFLRVLNDEELDRLMKYRHSSPKTPFEIFHTKYLSGSLEKYLIPECFSPNVITITGQIPGLILIIYVCI